MLNKNSKGQVAIFVALIFQVLFVFFAMVINVGLLIHHKINLQNSVDLAAYYGAMKQAEVMNAISHVNYQIRQSWKLMNFRYRHIGSAGDQENHPWNFINKKYKEPYKPDEKGMRPVFCINYPPIIPFNENDETYCKNILTNKIPKLGMPSWISGNPLIDVVFSPIQDAMKIATEIGNNNIKGNCEFQTILNYFMLARFIFSYKVDLANRKGVLLTLANSISDSTGDFQDLEGNSAKEGIKQTLIKNMSPQNRDSFQLSGKQGGGDLKIFNSLGAEDCKGTSGSDRETPKWLSEIFIYPIYLYVQGRCHGAGDIEFEPQPINVGFQTSLPPSAYFNDPRYAQIKNAIMAIYPFIGEPDGQDVGTRMYKTSLGYEKNPWCAAYVGVSASTTPKIPFSPFGEITLKATAFAKPFGGKIGPWYASAWNPGTAESDEGQKRLDPATTPRVKIGQAYDYSLDDPATSPIEPDHSRFTGDYIGTKTSLTTAEYSKSIHSIAAIDLHWWDQLVDPSNNFDIPGTEADPLAWDSKGNKSVPMRDLEIAAIAPDQFDLTHYSIDPDFYHNYILNKLDKRQASFKHHIRSDLGSRMQSSDKKIKGFGIRQQIEKLQGSGYFAPNSKLTYFSANFSEVLTGWHVTEPGNYSLDSRRFGKCIIPLEETNMEKGKGIPSSCLFGGRTGYSVKLVDGYYLRKSDLSFGGAGSSGKINNQWSDSDL